MQAQRDPLYKNMSPQEKLRAKSSPGLRQQLNEELIQRHALKAALQERWQIQESAPVVVHDALYKVIDGMAAGQTPQAILHSITSSCTSTQEHQTLMNAFYLPNGILKEIAHQIPETKNIDMPGAILSQEHAPSRFMLNQFVIDQHEAQEIERAQQATQGIEHIRSYLSTHERSHFAQAKQIYKELNDIASINLKQDQEQMVDAKSSMPMPPDLEPGDEKLTLENVKRKLDASKEMQQLRKQIEKLKKTTSDKGPKTCYSSDVSCKSLQDSEEKAKKFYDYVRKTNHDITNISKNTGINKKIINQIKNHLFKEKHILTSGIKEFDPNPDIAKAWKRLVTGSFVQSDLTLLLHEYSESLIMQNQKVEYSIAHRLIDCIYDWDKLLIQS